jgi:hypothetical protein
METISDFLTDKGSPPAPGAGVRQMARIIPEARVASNAVRSGEAHGEFPPATRAGPRGLGLVTLEQMLQALLGAVENPCTGVRVLGVPEIRCGTFDIASPAVTA